MRDLASRMLQLDDVVSDLRSKRQGLIDEASEIRDRADLREKLLSEIEEILALGTPVVMLGTIIALYLWIRGVTR